MSRKLVAREYAKAAFAMAVGALFAWAVVLAWMIDVGCFVRKDEAAARRDRLEMYDRVACSPADEFGGLGEGSWSK